MKKYLIQVTSKGTPENPNFAGIVNNYWCGQGSYTNAGRTVIENDCPDPQLAVKQLAKLYGYATERAAKCGLTYVKRNHDEESKEWNHHTFTHKVIAVEV